MCVRVRLMGASLCLFLASFLAVHYTLKKFFKKIIGSKIKYVFVTSYKSLVINNKELHNSQPFLILFKIAQLNVVSVASQRTIECSRLEEEDFF